MNYSIILFSIFLAIVMYFCFIKLYDSNIENMSDLESILHQINQHRKRKKDLKKKGKKKKRKKKIGQIRDLQEQYARLLQQLNDAKTRVSNSMNLMKEAVGGMKNVKDSQYEARMRTSQNMKVFEDYTRQYDILS